MSSFVNKHRKLDRKLNSILYCAIEFGPSPPPGILNKLFKQGRNHPGMTEWAVAPEFQNSADVGGESNSFLTERFCSFPSSHPERAADWENHVILYVWLTKLRRNATNL